ncbi:hypothetical protein Q8A73_005921 [Channa argus]|nr:hypothetical protein Q8A73_005921 [Channa argus]
MSQRFTVSKSDGDRRPSDIQGEVNQLFEGDDPPTRSGAEGTDSAGAEVVVVLKAGEQGNYWPPWKGDVRVKCSFLGLGPSPLSLLETPATVDQSCHQGT